MTKIKVLIFSNIKVGDDEMFMTAFTIYIYCSFMSILTYIHIKFLIGWVKVL